MSNIYYLPIFVIYLSMCACVCVYFRFRYNWYVPLVVTGELMLGARSYFLPMFAPSVILFAHPRRARNKTTYFVNVLFSLSL